MTTWVAIFIGGGFGSMARFAIGLGCTQFWNGNYPVATLISNVVSCVILAGVINAFDPTLSDNRIVRNALMIGFCGGFSTFSTFSYETVQLIKSGNHLVAAGNTIISVGVCLILLYKLTK